MPDTSKAKTCRTCLAEKPSTDFTVNDKAKGYLSPNCRPCAAFIKKAQRHADPEVYNVYQRAYYEANREKILPKARRANLRAYYKLKHEVFTLLGGECYLCGHRNWAVLQVDHINGDGAEHRRKSGGHTQSWRVIRDDLRNGVASTYQLLCANCHQPKSKVEQGRTRRLSSQV